MRVVFIGPPGSGKGTQARLLQERLGLAYVGTGEILREAIQQDTGVGQQAKPYIAKGQLVPDQIVNALIRELLQRPDHPDHFVLDGYPRTVAQAVALDDVLHEERLDLQAVIHFAVSDEEVLKRLISRNRSDDQEKTVRNRLAVYRATTADLLEHYRSRGVLNEVSASDSIENIYAKLIAILKPVKG